VDQSSLSAGRLTQPKRRTGWTRILTIVLVVASGFAGAATPPPPPESKISSDLQAVINATVTPKINWAKDVAGVRYVKALIVADSANDVNKVRDATLQYGGAVYYRYISVPALSVMLPAAQVRTMATRREVESISPNRIAGRTASTLESLPVR
jgi:hypothetical protein